MAIRHHDHLLAGPTQEIEEFFRVGAFLNQVHDVIFQGHHIDL